MTDSKVDLIDDIAKEQSLKDREAFTGQAPSEENVLKDRKPEFKEEIVGFRLVTGECLIVTMAEPSSSRNNARYKDVVQLLMTQQGSALMAMSEIEKLELRPVRIVYSFSLTEKILEIYKETIRQAQSDLVVPSKPQIVI